MTCPLMPHAARAQGWVPCQADGTLLQRGDSGFNADGSAGLLSSVLPTSTPTGVYGSLFGWWLDAYTPNASDRYGTSFGLRDGLALGSDAYNNADSHGIFDPNNSGSGPDIGGSVTATWHDTLTAHLKWTSYGPAPDPADFLLQTHVSATASPASSGLSSSASSFLGPLSVTATPDGNTASASDRRLLRLKPSGGVVTISLAGGVDTDTGNGLPYRTYGPADAWASAYASGSATPDNREVAISSDIETSYYKGQTDPNGERSDRWQHQPNQDGSMTVDAAATYSTADRNQQWVGTATLTANDVGFQSPQYAWSGGFNPVDSSPNMSQKTVYGEFLLGSANGLPSSTTVMVNVTGPDWTGGNVATATNTYTVNWHLPREKNTYLGAVKTKKINNTLASRIYPGPGQNKSLDPGRDIPYSAFIDGTAAVLDVAGQPEAAGVLDMLSKITDITDWKYQYGGDNTQSLVVNDDTEWENACVDNNETAYTGLNNIPAGLSNDPSNRALCYMNWCVVEKDTDASWYAYGYDGHGYDGVSTHPVNVHKIDMLDGQPVFVQYKNPDGTPLH